MLLFLSCLPALVKETVSSGRLPIRSLSCPVHYKFLYSPTHRILFNFLTFQIEVIPTQHDLSPQR